MKAEVLRLWRVPESEQAAFLRSAFDDDPVKIELELRLARRAAAEEDLYANEPPY